MHSSSRRKTIFIVESANRPTILFSLGTSFRFLSTRTGVVMVDGVFQPEELSLFRDIFDEAVSDLPPQMRTPVNQARIAKQILDCAATGERDPMELRVAAALNDTRAA